MKMSNGKTLIILATMHTFVCISPLGFASQFSRFAGNYFFKINEGLSGFPILEGEMEYESFGVFWFFLFGLLLIPQGILVGEIEKKLGFIPKSFAYSYLIIVLIGSYMIPFSGITFLMLPHAAYMIWLVEKKRFANI